MRFILKFCLILFVLLMDRSLAQVTVPEGVIYHKSSDSNNNAAKKLIKLAVESKKGKPLFESAVMIGPNLWKKYLNSNYAKAKIGIELNFKIRVGTEIVTRRGRIIKNKDEFDSFWEFVSDELLLSSLRIPNEAELRYYWSIISYDIEEPVFVMQNKQNKILINLSPQENKLVFLEAL